MIKIFSLFLYFAIFTFSLPVSAEICLPGDQPGNTCTAKDFTLTETLLSGPTSCTEGDLIDITLHIGMEPTANERYDIGIFVGDSGASPIGGASCTFSSLSPIEDLINPPPVFDGDSGSGAYRDLDGNSCGDTLKSDGEVFRDISLTDVLCQDTNGDGHLDVPYAVTWHSSIQQCDDPNDPNNFIDLPLNKCVNWVGDVDEIVVLPPQPDIPSITVNKVADPNVIHPGEDVTFTVTVVNDGLVTVELTDLDDNIFLDLNGQGSCLIPQILDAGNNYSCSFTETITNIGSLPEIHLNTVTAKATDSITVVNANDSALVVIIDSSNAGIGRFIWNDLNADGFWQAGEPGIDGVTIDLKDSVGAVIDTTVTSLGGEYEFDGLPADNYKVVVTDTAGILNHMVLTAGVEPHGVVLAVGQEYMQANFGYAKASIQVVKKASPTVIHAPDGDVSYTIYVSNVGPLDVQLVELVDNKFFELDGKGNCSTPQTLTVGSTYSCTFSQAITGNAGDTHQNTVVAVAADQEKNITFDANDEVVWIIDGSDAAIGDFVWFDSNRNGIQDEGEPGINGVTLRLERDSDDNGSYDEVVATITTANSGEYDFIDLAAGDYQVVVTDDNDALIGLNLTGGTDPHQVTLTSGQLYSSADFGYAKPPLPNISVHKVASPFVIQTGDPVNYWITVKNIGETDVNLEVLLDDRFGSLHNQGSCSLPQSILIGNIYSCSFTENVSGNANSFHINTVGAIAKDSNDRYAHDTNPASVFIYSGLIVTGTIGDLVWYDLNADGVADTDESGIAGVTLDLLQHGSVIVSTTTTSDGSYSFNNLPVGSYQVKVTDVYGVLTGAVLTGGSNPHAVALNTDEIYLNADFGYHRSIMSIPIFSVWGLAIFIALIAMISFNRRRKM